MTTIKLTRREQSALVIKARDKTLAIDMGMLTPAEELGRLPKVDVALVSHLHPDHFAPDHLRVLGAPVFGPSDVVSRLHDGMTATVLRPGETADAAGYAVTPVVADHGPKVTTACENLGFVIRCPGGHVIYYCGDICRPGTPPDGPFDTVVLPVGGAGFVFNAIEALAYLELIGHNGWVVPIHDTGPSDPDAIARFTELAPAHLDVIALGVGESTEKLA